MLTASFSQILFFMTIAVLEGMITYSPVRVKAVNQTRSKEKSLKLSTNHSQILKLTRRKHWIFVYSVLDNMEVS